MMNTHLEFNAKGNFSDPAHCSDMNNYIQSDRLCFGFFFWSSIIKLKIEFWIFTLFGFIMNVKPFHYAQLVGLTKHLPISYVKKFQ